MSTIPLAGRPFVVSLLALFVLPACASTRDADTGGAAANVPAEAVATVGDFADYLGRRSYVLRPAGVTVPLVLDRPGQAYNVAGGGGQLVVYEFDSAEEAARGVNALRLDALGGGTITVYQRGPLLVAYGGSRAALQLTLTQALGPPAF